MTDSLRKLAEQICQMLVDKRYVDWPYASTVPNYPWENDVAELLASHLQPPESKVSRSVPESGINKADDSGVAPCHEPEDLQTFATIAKAEPQAPSERCPCCGQEIILVAGQNWAESASKPEGEPVMSDDSFVVLIVVFVSCVLIVYTAIMTALIMDRLSIVLDRLKIMHDAKPEGEK